MDPFPVDLCILAVCRNNLPHKLADCRRFLRGGILQTLQLYEEAILINLERLADVDLTVCRILHPLFIHQHFFIKLLARTKTGKHDLDVFTDLVTGELDQVLGKIQNLHRFSHIKDENLTALCIGSCLKDQRHRLRNRHKVTDDVGVCHGHRTTGRDLLLEQRNDASVGAKNISKADRNKVALIMTVEYLNDHLTDTFRGTHDVGRIHRLVGRDHDESLGSVVSCRHRGIERSAYIVLNRLAGAYLHQRHVLVCGCMVDDIRPVFAENPVDPLHIPDRSDQNHKIQLRVCTLQLLLDVIGAVLIDINDDQLSRAMSRDLTAQLRSDGAASSGDTDHLSLYIADDRINIDLHRISSEKVLHLNIVQLGNTDLTVYQLVNSGERAHLALRLLADVKNSLQLCPGKRRDGNDDLINVVFLHGCRNLISSADDLDALNEFAPLVLGIVDQTLQIHRGVMRIQNFADNDVPRFPCSDDHDIGRIAPVRILVLDSAKESIGEAADERQ